MQKKYFLFFILLLLPWNAYTLELSQSDRFKLEFFFRSMIEKGAGGYVLMGKKPVCINGYKKIDHFYCENEHHIRSVCFRECVPTIKKLKLNSPDRNIIIHVYNQEDSLVKNSVHILFINRVLFLKTVQENLPLFQYVLGPEITPQRLLEKLIEPTAKFHSVMKNDKVLIGIILGFGTQNSLYVSREENIQDSLFSAEQPPLKTEISKVNLGHEFKHMLLVKDHKDIQDGSISPSFGFSSFEEEMKSLTSKLKVSSQKLATENPRFIFGRLKENLETDQLIPELEKTQEEIKKLLNSNNFLQDVLKLVDLGTSVVIQPDISDEKLENKSLDLLIAANIWTILNDESKNYQQFFIEGMMNSESGLILPHNDFMMNFEYDKYNALSKIKNNILMADDYFNQLDKDQSKICIIPLKLYYEIKKDGNGKILNKQNKVKIHYTFKTADDNVLTDTWTSGVPVELLLSNTISGFAHGIHGMKIGEVRDLFIHPTLAYGIYTTSAKGIHLRATVQLVGIDEKSNEKSFPELTLHKIDEIKTISEFEWEELSKKVAFRKGFYIWEHYKKHKGYTLPKVLEELASMAEGKEVDISFEEDQDRINRLHWNIYNSIEKD